MCQCSSQCQNDDDSQAVIIQESFDDDDDDDDDDEEEEENYDNAKRLSMMTHGMIFEMVTRTSIFHS